MAFKKPKPNGDGGEKRTLMSNQDVRKGDSATRGDKVCMTFWVTPERRAAIKAYAADHEMTVSRLIIEALNEKMGY